jgi:hypothetical protein
VREPDLMRTRFHDTTSEISETYENLDPDNRVLSKYKSVALLQNDIEVTSRTSVERMKTNP